MVYAPFSCKEKSLLVAHFYSILEERYKVAYILCILEPKNLCPPLPPPPIDVDEDQDFETLELCIYSNDKKISSILPSILKNMI